MKKFSRILVGLLVVIGAITTTVAAFLLFFHFVPASTDRYSTITQSPDGKNKAVRVTHAGGGALSPFCFDEIYLAPTTVSEGEIEKDKTYEIYFGDCGSFADRNPSPIVDWLSNKLVQITFATSNTRIRLSNIDRSKQIKVQFVVRD